MKITSSLFDAFLKCATKCHLRSLGEVGSGNEYAEWVRGQDESYRREAALRLQEALPETERVVAPPATENLKAAKWRLAVDLVAQTPNRFMDGSLGADTMLTDHDLPKTPPSPCPLPAMRGEGGRRPGEGTDVRKPGPNEEPPRPGGPRPEQLMESRLHAVERVPSEGRGKPAQFVPIRFVFRNKLTKDDRLLLAFDALVLSQVFGREVSLGKIIHGDDHATLKVKTSALVGEVRKRIVKVAELLSSPAPPDLVLNRHCAECEFQARCRKIAVEKDDLSLLAGMSAKERQKLRSKGIFTVTQLSYTFRPRRRPNGLRDKRENYHHSLKALAIREKKIHIVGSPELKIEGTPVYLDVEGLPDRDFYYLIGVRIGNGEAAIQHGLWADTAADERKIWREFLGILETIEKPVLIHYGSYETTFLKRMCNRHGDGAVRSSALGAIQKPVNLLSIIFAQIYFPAYSNRLKDSAGFIGFEWTDRDSSGLHAIAWRHDCEHGHNTHAKERLLRYNSEDCLALKQLTEHLQFVLTSGNQDLKGVVAVDNLIGKDDFRCWGQRIFAIDNFRTMADCAYFDYQRAKVFIRSNPEMEHVRRRKLKRATARNRPNKVIFLKPRQCWRCRTHDIVRDTDKWHQKLHLDLRFFPGGIRRWITEYRVPFCSCPRCNTPCFPRSYKSKTRFGHDLVAWVVHQHLTNRLSFENLEFTLRECFGLHLPCPDIHGLKYQAARYYKRTYNQILKNILASRFVNVDETKMKLTKETGYIWVFTSLLDVAYVYRPNREGKFLHDLLKDFGGVLVTDFYSAYDSLECEQQKCLIHLMWDINKDLLQNPFDDDLKYVAVRFGVLLRNVIQTVDRFGLKARFLRKHTKDVVQFYTAIELRQMTSQVAQHYRERLLKYREKLFVFLDRDSVPWNNNNAEHAIKPITKYRRLVKRAMRRKGLESYLVLMSIYQTCEYQGLSFLDFLRSRETDIHVFAESQRGRRRRTQTSQVDGLPPDAIPAPGSKP
jgi:predicted RecB family nuclease